jgi:hypothetical protein
MTGCTGPALTAAYLFLAFSLGLLIGVALPNDKE